MDVGWYSCDGQPILLVGLLELPSLGEGEDLHLPAVRLRID